MGKKKRDLEEIEKDLGEKRDLGKKERLRGNRERFKGKKERNLAMVKRL